MLIQRSGRHSPQRAACLSAETPAAFQMPRHRSPLCQGLHLTCAPCCRLAALARQAWGWLTASLQPCQPHRAHSLCGCWGSRSRSLADLSLLPCLAAACCPCTGCHGRCPATYCSVRGIQLGVPIAQAYYLCTTRACWLRRMAHHA